MTTFRFAPSPVFLQLAAYFLVSRILIVLVMVAGAGYRPDPVTIGQQLVDVGGTDVSHRFRNELLSGDAGWYVDIAQHGYEKRPFNTTRQANWAFFPMLPKLWKVTGLASHPIRLMILSDLFFAIGLAALYHLAKAEGFGEEAAERSVALLCFFPVSYFFSLPLTESLFLALSAGAFLAARKRKWWAMAMLGACACGTRLVGIFVLASLVIMLWQERETLPKRAWIALSCVPLGLLYFCAILWRKTGDPLAFARIQAAWGRSLHWPTAAFGFFLDEPLAWGKEWDFRILNFAGAALGVWALVYLCRQRRWPIALFLLLGMLAPIASGTLMSFPRYEMALFPLALALGGATSKTNVFAATLASFAFLLAVACTAFSFGVYFAQA